MIYYLYNDVEVKATKTKILLNLHPTAHQSQQVCGTKESS